MPLKSSLFLNVVWCVHVCSMEVGGGGGGIRQQQHPPSARPQFSLDHAGGRTDAPLSMCFVIALTRN